MNAKTQPLSISTFIPLIRRILMMFLVIPGIAFGGEGDFVVTADCELTSYKNQISEEVYVLNRSQIYQNCIKNITPDILIKTASNDPLYPQQWYLKNTGQTISSQTGISGKDIGYESAQESLRTISSTINVAIIDTGITQNGDLVGKLFSGKNTIDNSFNTVDDNGHGTAIASIIAANSNNSIGIAGISSFVKLTPIKAMNANGEGFLSDIIEGIQYAIDNNADIINLSLQGGYSAQMDTVIQSAYKKGIIVVTAAGNDGVTISSKAYSPLNNESETDWVIGVGATDNRGNIASYSNRGLGVDIYAPGTGIMTLSRTGAAEYYSGTSFSTAVVTGILANWKAYYGKLTPEEAQFMIDSYSVNSTISLSAGLIKRSYLDGMLVKSANSGVYLLQKGVKRPISHPSIFLSYGFEWSDIITISQESFSSIPEGSILPFREGTLLADNSTVYVIERGQKRPISSPEIFLANGYKWSNIITPPVDLVSTIPVGAVVDTSDVLLDGSLVYSDGTGVYLVEFGTKKPIPDPFTFISSGYRWQYLLKVSQAKLESVPTGQEVLPREGTIVRDNGAVYYIENSFKRPFSSPTSFIGLGFKWDKVQFPPGSVLDRIPTGAIIQ